MQSRMQKFQLAEDAIHALLDTALHGRLSTLNADGYPYTVPVHFVFAEGRLYVHGLDRGQKIDNIRSYPLVGFEVDELDGLLTDNLSQPCQADAAYRSVVAQGDARLIDDPAEKHRVLGWFVRKYTPAFAPQDMPSNKVMGFCTPMFSIESFSS